MLGLESYKPTDCVGTVSEARLAFAMCRARGVSGVIADDIDITDMLAESESTLDHYATGDQPRTDLPPPPGRAPRFPPPDQRDPDRRARPPGAQRGRATDRFARADVSTATHRTCAGQPEEASASSPSVSSVPVLLINGAIPSSATSSDPSRSSAEDGAGSGSSLVTIGPV